MTAPAIERPLTIWQTEPCAPWCTTDHDDADPIGGRFCLDDEGHVDMSLVKPIGAPGDMFLRSVHVRLEQYYREVEPHLTLGVNEDDFHNLTLAEAEAIGNQILARVAKARAYQVQTAGAAS